MGFKDLSERHDVKVREVYLWGVTSFSSKLLGSSGLMLAVKLLGAAAAYALAWWVSRHEGPSAYGRFELALTVLTIAALAARLGLDGVLVKWMSASNVKGDQGVQRRLVGRVMAVTGLLAAPMLAAVMWWASPGLTSWLGDETLDQMWPWVVAGVPVLTVWGVSSEALRGLSRMKSYALLQPGVVAAGAVVCMVGLGWSIVPSYAWSLVVSALLGLVLLIQALPKNKESVSALSSEWGWEAMLRTGWPMLLSSAMFLVMSWTDTLLLGHFLKEDQVGIYRVAFRLAAVVTLVQAAVNSYAAPLFAERHASGDRTGLKSALRQTTLLNVAFSLPAFAALVAVPEWWLGWFGEAFVVGAHCLVWLALGQVVNALCGPVMYLLNMTGHERPAQRIVWIAAMGNLALNLWAIPRFGIEGAAVATAFSMALWNVAAAVAVKRLLGLSVWEAIRGGQNTPNT